MTRKLYYDDSYIFEFDSIAADVIANEKYTAIELSSTAFFPLGGGQLPDTGYIGSCYIYDVRECDGRILHYTNDIVEFSKGESLHCRINESVRYARMQSHTGEHIVSGIANSLFSVENVGFHMDENNLMTVDFDKPLTKENIIELEKKANECIYSNVPVKASLHVASEFDNISYRSKLDFVGELRLVEISGYDICACCAPHVKHTGEVGVIKILSCVSHRGGVRITLLCGLSAYEDYCRKHNATVNIATMLCAKHNETDCAVDKLISANKELEYKLSCVKRKYLSIIADAFVENDFIVSFFDELSMDELRELCNFASSKCRYYGVFFNGNDTDGYAYCFYSANLKLPALIKDFNHVLNGSGGGRGEMAQGKLKATAQEIRTFLKNLRIDEYENA